MGETYDIATHQPTGDTEYRSPLERATDAFEAANAYILKLAGDEELSPSMATVFQFQTAQFEMLTAIHEQMEHMARAMQRGGDE